MRISIKAKIEGFHRDRQPIIEQIGELAEDLPRVFRVIDGVALGRRMTCEIADSAFEAFVCNEVPEHLPVKEEIARLRAKADYWLMLGGSQRPRVDGPSGVSPGDVLEDSSGVHGWSEGTSACAPIYEPQWWNNSDWVMGNNCYNYATNCRTDTVAIPGRASAQPYEEPTCDAVRTAAMADGLIHAPWADNRYPEEGHLVALAIYPGSGFHWYRKDRNGKWSHKPGPCDAVNWDDSGQRIEDPRTADRGPYTCFCTFMVVNHGHFKIK